MVADYSVSATTLEKYRRWLDDEDSKLTPAELAAEIVHGSPVSAAMANGSAVHEILEAPEAHLLDHVSDDGRRWYGSGIVSIDADTVAAMLSKIPEGGVREVPIVKLYRLGGCNVLVTMRADHMHGTRIYEHKTAWSEPTPYMVDTKVQGFIDSIQWRCYMDAFESVDQVIYNVWWMNYQSPVTIVTDYHQVVMSRPDNLTGSIESLLRHFVTFAEGFPELANHLKSKAARPDTAPF